MAKELELSVSTPELITRILGMGLGMAQVAKALGVSKRTLERRVAQNPAYRTAVGKGRVERQIPVLKVLYELALKGNMKAIAFWLTHIDSIEPELENDDFVPKYDPSLPAENHIPLSKDIELLMEEMYDLLHQPLPEEFDLTTGE